MPEIGISLEYDRMLFNNESTSTFPIHSLSRWMLFSIHEYPMIQMLVRTSLPDSYHKSFDRDGRTQWSPQNFPFQLGTSILRFGLIEWGSDVGRISNEISVMRRFFSLVYLSQEKYC